MIKDGWKWAAENRQELQFYWVHRGLERLLFQFQREFYGATKSEFRAAVFKCFEQGDEE